MNRPALNIAHKLSAHNAQTARFKADQRLTFTHLNSHGSVAGPDGCDVCGNTVVVRGYDCIACETAFNSDVADPAGFAVKLADVLVAHVRGARA